MKTEEDLIRIAMKLAEDDGNVRAVVVLPTWPHVANAFSVAKGMPDSDLARFKLQSTEVEFPSGGRVLFRQLSEENMNDWGGYQFTHAFVPYQIGYRLEALVKAKMRCARPLKVPMGFYMPHWIERWIGYD